MIIITVRASEREHIPDNDRATSNIVSKAHVFTVGVPSCSILAVPEMGHSAKFGPV